MSNLEIKTINIIHFSMLSRICNSPSSGLSQHRIGPAVAYVRQTVRDTVHYTLVVHVFIAVPVMVMVCGRRGIGTEPTM